MILNNINNVAFNQPESIFLIYPSLTKLLLTKMLYQLNYFAILLKIITNYKRRILPPRP